MLKEKSLICEIQETHLIRIIWIILIFRDIPDIFAWLGFLMITSSGVFIVYNESFFKSRAS